MPRVVALILFVAALGFASCPAKARAQSSTQPSTQPASQVSVQFAANSATQSGSASAPPAASPSSRRGVTPSTSVTFSPFSRVALSGGISPLGIGVSATTNINRHFNLRGTGNVFNYTVRNISTEGFNVTAELNLATAGASVDYYPFHNGFRLSPGVQFYNQNHAKVLFLAPPGTGFTLNNTTFFSASGANAVQGNGKFGLGNGSPAFTATTGWGNTIPPSGRHWTFPVEIGVAFIQDPTVSLTLSGYVCNAQGLQCQNVATDSTAQADLAQQVKKYQSDVNPLKTYPIVSFGVAYNFRIRGNPTAY